MPKGEGSVLLRFVRAIDRFTEAVGRVVAWLILPMVLSLVWEVTARYGFNAPTEWAYDMTFMLYGTFFMLGSAWTLQRGGHIRTDSFYSKWTPRTQARVDLVCYLVSSSRPSHLRLAVLGVLRQVVRAERADRHQPVAADRLAVQVRDAGRGSPAAASGARRIRALLVASLRRRRRGAATAGDAATDGEVTYMSPEWFGIVLLGVLFVAIFIGFPIAFTLIAVAAIGGYAMLGPLALHLMTLQIFSVMRDPTLASVPFFLFMGFLLEQSG
jgi:hypothetical protein